MNGVFITGTDTDVGKTVVSAIVLAAMRRENPVCYWKPVQTGIESDSDTETVAELAGCSVDEIHDRGLRLERPLSPHLAAQMAGTCFSVADIMGYAPKTDVPAFFVIEGAGGVLVPLNDKELTVDLMAKIGLPAIIVSRTGLGTINHTLLTIECLRGRGIGLAGVIMNGERNAANREAIEKYGGVKVLAEIPILEPLIAESVTDISKRLVFEFNSRPQAA